MNTDDINDADLDAFLKGEDALSGELQAMQQASPSAELDAAILSRAQAQMARDSRPDAANDPGPKAPLSRLGLRWRVPAGIAATLMAGVLAHQAWQASSDSDRVAKVPVPTARRELASPPQPGIDTQEPAAPQAAPPPRPMTPAPRRRSPAPATHSAAAVRVEAYAPPPPSYAPAPAPAPAVADLMRAKPQELRRAEASGRLGRAEPQTSNAAPATAMAIVAPDPGQWLAAIDALLKAGQRRDALEEWDKFRAAHPDYPVPAETTDKVNALRK